jgi:hypothetical protein
MNPAVLNAPHGFRLIGTVDVPTIKTVSIEEQFPTVSLFCRR